MTQTTHTNQDRTASLLSSNTLHVADVFGADFMTLSVFPSSPESGAAVFTVNGEESALVNLADARAIRDFLNVVLDQAVQ